MNEWQETHELYMKAEDRVDFSPTLKPYKEIILADWPEGDDHWRWVASADESEIENWASTIAKDASDD